jgi:asparagine synthase (glutamine-hydrolysing)
MIKVNVKEHFFWKKIVLDSCTLWLKGYIHNKTDNEIIEDFSKLNSFHYERYLLSLDGHFALIFRNNNLTLIAVDKVRSIPLFYNDLSVSSEPMSILNSKSVNHNAVLSIRMSGYTIGEDTIYRNLNALIAGQFVVFKLDQVTKKTYYKYTPWIQKNKNNEIKLLAKTTINILKKMIKSLEGRQVIIPLSAGNDSRLIASGLKHLGYENVKCYSYGIKGNFEAKIAKTIAEKLGYEYKFLEMNLKQERIFYKSKEFKEYLIFSDSCVSIPYFQSISTIPRLKGWIDSDAIFVNGNSGDFISGGHIKSSFNKDSSSQINDERLDFIVKENIEKHFSLWGSLKNQENIKNISTQLQKEIQSDLTSSFNDEGFFEYSEFINRQSKYVISGQRAYEFYGYEWRLPLWDDEYLDFWSCVPIEYKLNQKLYINMLRNENWGDVWIDDFPVNNKNIRPIWIIPLRVIVKIPFLFLGKNLWHKFEVLFFYYFMDSTRMMSSVKYIHIIKSIFKSPRNHASWQTKDYLSAKGIK